MSTINGVAQVRRTATPVQQVTSLFLRVWSAWQKRRRRLKVQTALCALSDRELIDLGATRAEIDYIALQQGRARPDRPAPWRIGSALAILLVVNLFSLISVDRAEVTVRLRIVRIETQGFFERCRCREIVPNRRQPIEAVSRG